MTLLVRSVNVQPVRTKTMFVHGGVKAAQAAVANILVSDQITERGIETHQMVSALADPDLCNAMHQQIRSIGSSNRFWSAGQIIRKLEQDGWYETGCLPAQIEEALGMPAKYITIYALGNDKDTCSFELDFGLRTKSLAAEHDLTFSLAKAINVNVEVVAPGGQLSFALAELAASLPLEHALVLTNLNEAAESIMARSKGRLAIGPNLAIRLEIAGLSNITAAGQVINGNQAPGQTPTLTFALYNPTMWRARVHYGYILEAQEPGAMAYAQVIAAAFRQLTATAEVLETAMQDAIPATPEEMIQQPIHPSILANDARLRQMFMAIWNNYSGSLKQPGNLAAIKLKEIIDIWENRGYIDPNLTGSHETYELVGNALVKAAYAMYPKDQALYHYNVARYLTLANTLSLFKSSPASALEETPAILACLFTAAKEIEADHPELIALKQYIDAHPITSKDEISAYGPALLASINSYRSTENPYSMSNDGYKLYSAHNALFEVTWQYLMGQENKANELICYLAKEIQVAHTILPIWAKHLQNDILGSNREKMPTQQISRVEALFADIQQLIAELKILYLT